MPRLLVAFDGSPSARAALARCAALFPGAEVVVATVAEGVGELEDAASSARVAAARRGHPHRRDSGCATTRSRKRDGPPPTARRRRPASACGRPPEGAGRPTGRATGARDRRGARGGGRRDRVRDAGAVRPGARRPRVGLAPPRRARRDAGARRPCRGRPGRRPGARRVRRLGALGGRRRRGGRALRRPRGRRPARLALVRPPLARWSRLRAAPLDDVRDTVTEFDAMCERWAGETAERGAALARDAGLDGATARRSSRRRGCERDPRRRRRRGRRGRRGRPARARCTRVDASSAPCRTPCSTARTARSSWPSQNRRFRPFSAALPRTISRITPTAPTTMPTTTSSEVLEQDAERDEDDAERRQRVEAGEGRRHEGGDRPARHEQAEGDVAQPVPEEEAQPRPREALEPADGLQQPGDELAVRVDLPLTQAARKPDLLASDDELEREEDRDDLEDVRRAAGRQRQGGDAHEHDEDDRERPLLEHLDEPAERLVAVAREPGVELVADARPRRAVAEQPSGRDAARLAGGLLGRLELALDEVEARVPEARVGEVDADHLPELLRRLGAARAQHVEVGGDERPRPPPRSAGRPTGRGAGRRRTRRRSRAC